jgi:hypothetical protein
LRIAWAVASTFVLAAGATVLLLDVSAATEKRPQGLYALSASAQALGAVLGLVLATATVVAQLRGLFSRQSLAGGFRDVFGSETMVMVGLFGTTIWVQLAIVSTRYISPTLVRVLLVATATCLGALGPYLVLLRRRLSPRSSLADAGSALRRRADEGDAKKAVDEIGAFALTAVHERDYATLQESLDALGGAFDYGAANARLDVTGAAASALRTVALNGYSDPVTVSWVLKQLSGSADRLCRMAEDGPWSEETVSAAEHICDAVSTVAEGVVPRRARSDGEACADILGNLGVELARSGRPAALAAAVAGLVRLKVDGEEAGESANIHQVTGRAARELARIHPGASRDEPWPRRPADPSSSLNLLLNASFDFGHEFGFGREPGWFRGPYAKSMWMSALPFGRRHRPGQFFLRIVADGSNQSVAQDVPATPTVGESFVAVFRAASADDMWVRGRIGLWALGPVEERGGSGYELPPRAKPADSSGSLESRAVWRVLSAPLDVSQPRHDRFRAELYIDESGPSESDGLGSIGGGRVLLDDGALVAVTLQNASFELRDLSYWEVEGDFHKVGVLRHEQSPADLGGEWFARLEPTDGPVAIRQRIVLRGEPAHTHELSAHIRSAEGEAAVVRLDVRTDEGPIASMTFTVGREWHQVFLPFVPRADGSRLEEGFCCNVGLTVATGAADVDGVAVVSTLLQDADFDRLKSWITSPPGTASLHGGCAPDYGGTGVVRLAGEQSIARIWQELMVTPPIGTSYRFSIRMRLRSAPNDPEPIVVRLTPFDELDRELPSVSTRTHVTSTWTLVFTSFDCARGDVRRLRAIVEVPRGVTVELDGATFNPLVIETNLAANEPYA